MRVELPQPNDEENLRCQRLIGLIQREITEQGGSISFARYMDLALYAPGVGYYSAGQTKFGPAGDFITAPEISSLFGRCVARQCQQVLRCLNGGDLLELGAGTGKLAADIMKELECLNTLPVHYYILEPSPNLRHRQRDYLARAIPHLLRRVEWLYELPRQPLTGMILANEVLDALPVEVFELTETGCQQKRVGWDNGLVWQFTPASTGFVEQVDALLQTLEAPLPRPYRSEINTLLQPWLASLTDCLDRGLIWFADYGYTRHEYYHPERREGTLSCHYRQRMHDNPLILTGLQDITAFVDFTAVAEAAVTSGLDVAGFTSQAHFLLSCGLDNILNEIHGRESEQFLDYVRQVKLLTLPAEMGEVFKMMALTKSWEEPLLGFQWSDLRGRL